MMTMPNPLLEVEVVSKRYEEGRPWWRPARRPRRAVTALSDVSFPVRDGERIGIVGESGSGKTTLARLMARLDTPTSGRITLRDRHPDQERRDFRQRVRMIFQHPEATLNPGYSIGIGLTKALTMHTTAASGVGAAVVRDLLASVGLEPDVANKRPAELSGGQKRRVGICRALAMMATKPELIIADEPWSGLDVIMQELILGLLAVEQATRGFALLVISHDLDRVYQLCDRVLVMHAGRLVEDCRLDRSHGLPAAPFRHPYGAMLDAARSRVSEHGAEPVAILASDGVDGTSQVASKEGCRFAPACPRYRALGKPIECREVVPPLSLIGLEHRVACHFR